MKFSWSSLSDGDWISVGFFPVSVAIGWSSIWSSLAEPWSVLYTIIFTVVHCFAFLFFMLYVMRLVRTFRASFGRFTEGVSLNRLAQRRQEAWHMRKCVQPAATNRYFKRIRESAERRRRDRESSRRQYFCHLTDTIADSYEDSSSWMSAALASGGLFTWMFQVFQPGPSVIILFIPFALIPAIHIARTRALSLRTRSIT